MGLGLAVAGATLVLALPSPPGLPEPGRRMAALFLVALVLWASEAIPIAATALLAVLLQPVFGVAALRTAFEGFVSPVFFFVLAMFCLAQAFSTSGLARRLAVFLLARAGDESRRVVLGLMAGTALLSTVTSDVPCCALFMAVALGVLARAGAVAGASGFGKALMIGIPMASLIGGIATPAGSSVNILGIQFIEQYGHVRVPFLHWMAIGVPMVVVLLPLAWLVVVRCCPPEMERVSGMRELAREEGERPWSTAERKLLAILAVMIGLWIASTWIEVLDVVGIGLAGAVAMFLPGIALVDWRELERSVGWDALFMIGGVTSLGAASVETGLAQWMVETALAGVRDWSPAAAVAAISAFTVVIHLVIPIGPVVNAVLIPPIALLATTAGQSPALYALPVAFTASCAFLLPLDAVPLITYSRGYYRMIDMLLPGSIVSLIWVALMTLLMVGVAPRLGLL